jgi:kynureninase
VLAGEDAAHELDRHDPGWREQFHIPPASGGRYPLSAYFAGNSLGLLPRATGAEITEELAAWAQLGVEGHRHAARPWYSYHELLREPAARLVGGRPSETVVMNSLTVNLHLMMASFYRPQPGRSQILIEDLAFPSDSYAVRSQARWHGLDADATVVRLRPRAGEDCLRTADVVAYFEQHGAQVAVALFGGVNYLTGEVMDIPAITEAAHAAGFAIGWDLAHAAGNVPLRLHDWGVDFAAWCSYKYLNSGPGAVAGCFVHERHLGDRALPRLEGWWSTDPDTRFDMAPECRPPDSVDAWQISNPPILAMSPVRTSLAVFDAVGMPALRERSLRLTDYLLDRLDEVMPDRPLSVVTPRDPSRRGSQISVRLGTGRASTLSNKMRQRDGVVADAREPDIIRFAPTALYGTYHDCWRAADALARWVPRR